MKLKVRNKCLAAGEINGYVLTDEALADLTHRLIGANVFLGQRQSELGRASHDRIGTVENVVADTTLIIDVVQEDKLTSVMSKIDLTSKLDFIGVTDRDKIAEIEQIIGVDLVPFAPANPPNS